MALMLCLISIMGFSQFSSENFMVETVDEFGNKTGNFKVGMIAEGYFSNSETPQSCANLIISFMENSSWCYLYEYCGDKSSDKDFNITFVGTTTNTTISDVHSLIELCENNNTINVKMIENTEYGNPTTAEFKLSNCNEFYSLYTNQFEQTNDRYISYEYDNSISKVENEMAFMKLKTYASGYYLKKFPAQFYIGYGISFVGVGTMIMYSTNVELYNNLKIPGSALCLIGALTTFFSYSHCTKAGKILQLELDGTGGKIKYKF